MVERKENRAGGRKSGRLESGSIRRQTDGGAERRLEEREGPVSLERLRGEGGT